jgi:iron complex transport system substrate-binding protein
MNPAPTFRRTHLRSVIRLVFAACALATGGAALAAGITVHDARSRDVTIENPARMVSIGGAITEILYALGVEERIAGVDATSLFPAAALRDKPSVGYMRQLSAEGVLGLNPSLVLAMQGSGPKEVLDVLEAAKVPLVLVPEILSEQGLLDKIRLVGRAMGVESRAACLTDAVANDLAQLRALRARVTKPVRVMFVMSLLNGRALAAGQNTAADEIIRLAGGVNAIDGYAGYKMINDEAILAARPDVVLSIDRGPDTPVAEAIYGHPAFATTPVAANKAFISMEGLYLLGFGPRTAAAVRDLSIRLYPALAPQAAGLVTAALSANCRQ